MNILNVSNPYYTNPAHTMIHCIVTIKGVAGPVPFIATADDPEEHGAALFASINAGDHGVVAAYVAPALDMAALQSSLSTIVQRHVDQVAQSLGYDNIATAVTYADEPTVPLFEAQGKALRAWRSEVWASCIATLKAVVGGSAALPSAADLIASLPPFKFTPPAAS